MTVLTNDGVLAVAERLGVQTLPLVLAVAPTQDSHADYAAAQQSAVADLTDAGVFDTYGDVTPEVSDAMYVLSQPDRELVARVYTGGALPIRICLARRDSRHALAVRSDDELDISTVWADDPGAALRRPLGAALGACAPAEVANFSAPTTDLARRLDAATTSAEYADAVYALGVTGRDATEYAMAFESCHAYAEIVACAHIDGVTTRPPCAVAVYDTGRGRIVVAPGIAPDQQVWSTVTPGSDHRLAQAISGLIELLPGGRWLPL
ncbi:ESX secretion-associated protein EspG [Nocardia sp. NPDC058705]|uniref:ESX secretion-associated protein EspG n=1 Tax=Nocardia sp. NPDC058705 TaxID=3346609 RepID=UPI0036A36119